jgi:hypothetical protein
VGDGLYNFVKVIAITVKNIRERSRRKNLNRGNWEITLSLLPNKPLLYRELEFILRSGGRGHDGAGRHAARRGVQQGQHPDVAVLRGVRGAEPDRGDRHPDHVPGGEVVLRGGGVRAGAGAGVLQRVRDRADGHEHGVQLREDRAVRAGGVGGEGQRRGGRAGGVRAGEAAGARVGRPDARLQDGAPDADVAAVDAGGAGRGHADGVRPGAAHLHALLQGVRRGRAGRVLEGPLRAHLPQHGHPRRGGLLGAAQALPAAVRGVLRVRGAGEPGAGPAAAPARAARAAAHGHGRAVPRGRQLRRRHVRGEPRGVRVAQARRQEGRAAGAGRRLGAHLRRRDLDVPVVAARAGQGQAAHLHEVHARELESTVTMRTEQRASFVVCGVESV